MAEFGIVDLSVSAAQSEPGGEPITRGSEAQSAGAFLGNVDTAVVASALEALREDLSAHVKDEKEAGLHLSGVKIRLTLSAEGKVAFVAKGAAEASIEVEFSSSRHES